MTIQYHKFGDYYLPNLVIEDIEVNPIGKYGRMRKRYLKERRPVLYSNLLLFGKLFQHMAEIDGACEERLELLIRQMAKQEGVTEALKAADQMEWVRRMNSIRNHAEEIVLSELVYRDRTALLIARSFQGVKLPCCFADQNCGKPDDHHRNDSAADSQDHSAESAIIAEAGDQGRGK